MLATARAIGAEWTAFHIDAMSLQLYMWQRRSSGHVWIVGSLSSLLGRQAAAAVVHAARRHRLPKRRVRFMRNKNGEHCRSCSWHIGVIDEVSVSYYARGTGLSWQRGRERRLVYSATCWFMSRFAKHVTLPGTNLFQLF